MLPSGISPLDQRLGGLIPGRTYVVTGAPGTCKTVACLEFLAQGLSDEQPVALLTHDDPSDLMAQGVFLGIDLEKALADDRLVLLRFQLDFTRRFARAASPEVAFEEMRRLLGTRLPSRIAVDSIAPFLEGSTASGNGVSGLMNFLAQLGATSMVTYPADLAGLYDRRLEPLVQRAAAIFHFSTSERDHCSRIEIRKIRYTVPSTAPVMFTVRAGAGIAAFAESLARRADDLPPETRRKLIIVNLSQTVPEETVTLLRTRFDVVVRDGVASAFSELSTQATGAVLVDVRRDTVADALTLVRELRRSGKKAPIILLTPDALRSSDRARALRMGADEFIAGELHPHEFLTRIEQIVRRGRAATPMSDAEVALVAQPGDGERLRPMDAAAFRQAVRAHITGDQAPFFTIARLTPPVTAEAPELCEAALHTMRAEWGDLAGMSEGTVSVYLHSARRKDVTPFIERLKEQWRTSARGELVVETLSYPGDERRIEALVGATTGSENGRPMPTAADAQAAVSRT